MASTTQRQVISTLLDGGFTIELLPDSGLKVTPASRLTPNWRDFIRRNKAVLVDCLTQEAANDSWNVYIPPGTSPETVTKFRRASLALDASQRYYDHHFKCPVCIAAGQGYGLRCGVGTALWSRSQNEIA